MFVSFRDTIKVRKGEELNKEPLQKFIQENITEAPIGDLEIEQFSVGHSNLTYLLRIGEWEAVLRRPPHGPVAKKPMTWEGSILFYLIYIRYFQPHQDLIFFPMTLRLLAVLFLSWKEGKGLY